MPYLLRLLFPFLMKWLLRKIQNPAQRQNNNSAREKEGDIHIKAPPTPKSDKKDGLGEYVDFEEIND